MNDDMTKKKIININYDGERLAKALKELEK